MGIGERIKDERNRIGLTQEAFAFLAGASKNSQLSWEKEIAFPNAAVLEEWAKNGADVLYILTGQRSQQVRAVELLPEDERIMLDNYRHAPAAVRSGIKQTLGAFAPAGGTAAKRRANG